MERAGDSESSAFASKGFEQSEWKSPRKINEEKLLARRERFEFYMGMVAINVYTLEEAIAELRDEISKEGVNVTGGIEDEQAAQDTRN